jgi:hypothetical protein
MQHFHHGPQLDGAFFFMRKQLGGKQQQHRTDALASARTQMLADIGDGPYAGDRIAPKLALNGSQIVAQ